MKQIILTTAIILLTAISATAQATSRDFNDIKRSNRYYYSEATLATAEDSKEYATRELIKIINDSIGFTGEKKRPGVKEVTKADLTDLNYLQMDRSHGVRVMVFCPKSTFVSTPVAIAKPSPAKSLVPPKKDSGSIAESPRKEITPAASSSTANKGAATVPGYEDWMMRDIESLLKISSSNEFVNQLAVMQSKHKIKRFGPADECRNADGSFWAVFDSSGSLTALLGPGSGKRKNFMSGTDQQLSDYLNNNSHLLWFQFSK